MDLTPVLVAAIAATPATLAQLNKRKQSRQYATLRKELRSHTEDDAQFQRWIIRKLANGDEDA